MRFLEDGRIEIDSKAVERAMHPVTLTRKNALFAGGDERAENSAMLASLIETCNLQRVNPETRSVPNRHSQPNSNDCQAPPVVGFNSAYGLQCVRLSIFAILISGSATASCPWVAIDADKIVPIGWWTQNRRKLINSNL